MASTTRTKTTTDGPVETTTKTTKTTYSSSSYDNDFGPSHYNSQIRPRTILIQRSGYGSPAGVSERSVRSSYSYGVGAGPSSGAYSSVIGSGVTQVKTHREQEKKDMRDLNERLAGYIEKVRFLEAQNRKLAAELEQLKDKWGKETSKIKEMYQTELDEARRLLDENEKDKARLEIKVSTMEEQLEESRKKVDLAISQHQADRETIERQNQQLSDYEAEINLLRRRIAALETERERDKKEIARLSEALTKARIDLDNETLQHIDAENRRQTLEEEIEFLKGVHEQELRELAALAYRDPTAENREFWKNEMAQAIRDIQDAYDEKIDTYRSEMDTFYNLKMQEFRTGATRNQMETEHSKEETKRFRTQLTDLRNKVADLEARNGQLERELAMLRREYEEKEKEWLEENDALKREVSELRTELDAVLQELQAIMDIKMSLELEIAAYRKLLEGEENRHGLKQVVESWISTGQEYGGHDDSRVSQVVKGEMSAKTTYQRSAKGPVSISECSSDGNFITLENTGKKDEVLEGWAIVRTQQDTNKTPVRFTFPKGAIFTARQKNIKIFAKGHGGPNDFEGPERNWGTSGNITTALLNPSNEERATHVQRTTYTS